MDVTLLQGIVTRKIETTTVDKSCLSFVVVNTITAVCSVYTNLRYDVHIER